MHHVLNLARLFDLSEVGEYRLSVEKSARVGDEYVTVKIEEIPLVVREPNRAEFQAWH